MLRKCGALGVCAAVLAVADGRYADWVRVLNGTSYDTVAGVVTDAEGNTYIAGTTFSAAFPTTAGSLQPQSNDGICSLGTRCGDAYIAKLDRSGRTIWASYLGTSGPDRLTGMAVDASGFVYVLGARGTPDGAAAFVARIAPDGSAIGPDLLHLGHGYTGTALRLGREGVLYVAGNLTQSVSGRGLLRRTGTTPIWAGTGALDPVYALVRDPGSGALYAGGVGQVSYSLDNGNAWRRASTGLPAGAVVRALAVDPSEPGAVYAGTFEGVYKSSDGAASWTLLNVPFVPVHSIAVDQAAIYVSTDFGIYRSVDRGVTWIELEIPGAPWLTELLASRGSVYGATLDGVLRSDDGGASWRRVLQTPSEVTAITAVPGGRLYAGLRDGTVWSSEDGEVWMKLPAATLPSITAFAPDPVAGDVLYAATENGLYVTGNGGLSWALAPGFSAEPVQAVLAGSGWVLAGVSSLLAEDVFVARIDQAAPRVIVETLSGSGMDRVSALEVDSENTVWIGGQTGSADLPRARERLAGGADAFVARFSSADLSLVGVQIFGGAQTDDNIAGLALLPGGAVAAAVNSSISGAPHSASVIAIAGATGPAGSASWPRSEIRALAAGGQRLWAAGRTQASGLASADAWQRGLWGLEDAFTATFEFGDDDQWFSYLGGPGREGADAVSAGPGEAATLAGGLSESVIPYRAAEPGAGGVWIARFVEGDAPGPVVNAVVDGAAFTRRVAPGCIVSIFGTGLADAVEHAGGTPLPVDLRGTRVTFNGVDAPLFYISPGQLNVQAPAGIAPGSASVVVYRQSRASAPLSIEVAGVSPVLWDVVISGSGGIAAAVAPGDRIVLYATGLGALREPVPTGHAFPGPSTAVVRVTATVDGVPATVEYAGAAPGFVGLYQVNVVVPSITGPEPRAAVAIEAAGAASNTIYVAKAR